MCGTNFDPWFSKEEIHGLSRRMKKGKLQKIISLFWLVFMVRFIPTFSFARTLKNFAKISTEQMSSLPSMFEVEQKFALLDGIQSMEERLLKLGMTKSSETLMMDWYFDLPAPDWILTPQDCWLRCRETPKGSVWQLKQGTQKQQQQHEGGATVYEEVEGEDAINIALSLLPATCTKPFNPPFHYESFLVPKLPKPCHLVPFARIETLRSRWEPTETTSPYSRLVVDLDRTNYNYTVGEVEILVHTEDEVAAARRRIGEFVQLLLPSPSMDDNIGIGKLEYYMSRHCKAHYEACVRGGSIQKR